MTNSLLALHTDTNNQANSELITYPYLERIGWILLLFHDILKIHNRALNSERIMIILPVLKPLTMISSSASQILNLMNEPMNE